jgi:hypothetical protein
LEEYLIGPAIAVSIAITNRWEEKEDKNLLNDPSGTSNVRYRAFHVMKHAQEGLRHFQILF